MGATLRCCVQAFHCSSFFCWRAQRASWLPELRQAGLVAPGHVKSSQTRDQSCVPCVLTIGPPGKSSFRLCIWKNVQCTEKLQEQYGKVVRFTNCYHMVFPVVMYGCESWSVKTDHQRIAAFKLWCWRRLLRVPWTARRSNQFILKEISPEYSLEGLL